MKKFYIVLGMASLLFINGLTAQEFVNNVLIGTGGIYGNEDDHVTVSAYSPVNDYVTLLGEVMTESIQDLALDGNFVYVAAQDSLAKFDISTGEKTAVTVCSNVNQLLVSDGKLFVSRWGNPEDNIFVKIYDAGDLSPVSDVEGISGDAADMMMANDTLYVAVNGGWTGTEGKLAVINSDYIVEREINFGTDAVGIFDLFYYDGKIYSVNRTPYSATTGSITAYDVSTTVFSNILLNHVTGKGFDRYENVLYLFLDGGVASFDMAAGEIINPQIVPPSTSSFSAGAYDHVNDLFYLAETDYFSMGTGAIYNAEGELLDTFEAGISTEALLIEYQTDITFDDIDFWVGQGQKKAMLVVDWNDGNEPEALAWGFRWDGDATGQDLLEAVAAADSALTVEIAGGFLNSIFYTGSTLTHEGEGGANGYYWATYSGTGTGNWYMNQGISTALSDGDRFGCSYTDFNPATAPEVPVPASNPAGISKDVLAFDVYPNPVSNFFVINMNGIQKVEIFSLQGQKLSEKRNTDNNQSVKTDVSGLAQGIYLVKISAAGKVYTSKFIKQ